METVKITTSQNVEIDYAVATLSDRIKGRIIDYLVFSGFSSIVVGVFAGIADGGGAFKWSTQVITAVIWLALFVFYDLVCEVFFNGQSLGKRAAKIRVISLNGARPTISQYLLRWFFRVLDFGLSLGSLAVVTLMFSEKRQRVGDIVAGTTVVKTEPVTVSNNLFFNMPGEEYQPTYPEVSQLTDRDIHLVYDVIRNFNFTRNSALVYKLAIKLKKHLNVNYPREINEYQFLEIVVNDYTNLTTRSDA